MQKLKIEGMHCGACEKLIQMELDDNGVGEAKVNGENHEVEVADELVDEAKKVINSMDAYSISN